MTKRLQHLTPGPFPIPQTAAGRGEGVYLVTAKPGLGVRSPLDG